MSGWTTRSLRTLVNAAPKIKPPAMDAEVWSLNLDQIEAHGGRVLEKVYVEAEKLGPSTFPFEARTVLYSKLRPYLNKVVVADEAGFATTELVPLRCNPDEVYPEYLAYFLRSEEFLRFATEVVAGAKMPRMVMTAFWGYQIPLPPIAEQRRIAAILDQATALRIKRREVLVQLDSLTQSIFIEMFGDPIKNSKDWPLLPFEKVCETRLGKMLDQKQQTGSHVRKYIRNANVQWFRIDISDVFEMDFDEKARQIFQLKHGDLLICEGGEPGRTAIWRDELSECYYQKALHRGRPNPQKATSEYLAWLLWFLSHQGGLADHVTAATIAHLTGEKLKAMNIPVPPLKIQIDFVERLRVLDELKACHSNHLVKLDALFASLQHRAFQGKL